jgi:arabinogalactan oligomer/maltooligosaccharide transport system substrate-binding protein
MFSNKKKVAAVVATTGLLLAGFAGVSPAQAAPTATLLVWADESRGPHLQTLFGSLDSQKVGDFVDGYKIEVVPYSNFDALKAALDSATAQNGPDVVLGANDWVSTGVKNGKLASVTLSSAVKKNFTANALGDLSYQGKLYGVPLDVNNVVMIRNTRLAPSAPKTFGEMVNLYTAKKTSKGLKAGLCIAGGGMSWGAHSVLSALGGGAYRMTASGKVDTKANPTDVTAFTANVKKYLLKANGKSNGFFPSTDQGCKDNFLAGKVPYAVIGNWEWSSYEDAGFSMSTVQPVPGVTAGTYGSAFGSVSGALLTSFAATRENASGAKALLNYFASTLGAKKYELIEKRPPANINVVGLLPGQTAFAKAAKLASVPQIGPILNGGFNGSKSYWDTSGQLWKDVLGGKNVKSAATQFNKIMKANATEGAKLL